jgi:hypothetical protein
MLAPCICTLFSVDFLKLGVVEIVLGSTLYKVEGWVEVVF